MYLRLTQHNGTQHFVNADLIRYIKPNTNGSTYIHFDRQPDGTDGLTVTEDYEEICEKIAHFYN